MLHLIQSAALSACSVPSGEQVGQDAMGAPIRSTERRAADVQLTLVREEYNIGWVNITFHRQVCNPSLPVQPWVD